MELLHIQNLLCKMGLLRALVAQSLCGLAKQPQML